MINAQLLYSINLPKLMRRVEEATRDIHVRIFVRCNVVVELNVLTKDQLMIFAHLQEALLDSSKALW